MNKRLNRRQFLRLAANGMGALALQHLLSACQGAPVTPEPGGLAPTAPLLRSPTANPAATQPAGAPETEGASPSDTAAPSAAAQADLPDLAVARGPDPEALVRRAVAALGGMERFVAPGAKVLIKPNVCNAYHAYEYATTTNPWVVGALVKLAWEAGAGRVQVMDYPFGGSAEEAYERSGIAEQVRLAGGELLPVRRFGFKGVKVPEGLSLKKTAVYDAVLDADVLINTPIAKHHGSARLTIGMKNLLGVIKDRGAIHEDLGQRIADLNSRVRSNLVVVDAVRILMDHGPTGGDLNDVKQMDTVIATTDVVAADSYAAMLFGRKPEYLKYVTAGAAMGLGRSDLEALQIEEISVGG